MRKLIYGILVAYAVPLIVFLGVFLSVPKLYVWHDIYASIPAFVTRYPQATASRNGNFEAAAKYLNRQANIAEFLGINSYMRQDLLDSTRQVMNQARYRAHYVAIKGWLERLSHLADNYLAAQIYLGEAQSAADPMTANAGLIRVTELVPALDRPYRPLLEQALRYGHDVEILALCRRFLAAQAGNIESWVYRDATYAGQGIGNFYLEVDDGSGGTLVLPHSGFVFGEARDYAFDRAELPAQEVLRLHLPSLPGLIMRLDGVAISDEDGERKYGPDGLRLHSRHGYFIDAATVLIGTWRGDVVTLFPRQGSFPAADRIVLRLAFRRPALVDHEACR